MKRYVIGTSLLADLVFVLSLGVNTWQALIVFVAIAAAVALGVFAWVERLAINEERERAGELAEWIHDHHPPKAFQPFDGDEKSRS